MADTVKVRCPFRNGISLHIDEFVEGPMGIKTARPKGDAVVLKEGDNEVSAEFWRAWSEQQKDMGLLGLKEIDDAEKQSA